MKKVLATILVIIYLSTSVGASVTMHYCMGKFSSIDFVSKKDCTKCGMKKAKGCCHDEVKVVKLQDNHQLINQQTSFTPFFSYIKENYNLYQSRLPFPAEAIIYHTNSPPRSSVSSLCILNCVFRL